MNGKSLEVIYGGFLCGSSAWGAFSTANMSSVTSSRDNCKYANVLSASQDIDNSMMHGNSLLLLQEDGNDRTKKWYWFGNKLLYQSGDICFINGTSFWKSKCLQSCCLQYIRSFPSYMLFKRMESRPPLVSFSFCEHTFLLRLII